MRGVFKMGVIDWGFGRESRALALKGAWYSIGSRIASKTQAGISLPPHFLCVPLPAEKIAKIREIGMTSRLEAHRVQAYNTAKLSENKMHDDTVARRFGFSGGLVPGVDVMAYMMHLPVAKWGRAFLERGLIEARFAKPVYDGEIAEIRAEKSDGVLTIEVESRGELCATGTASLPTAMPQVSLSDFSETAGVAERSPVNAKSYELGKWLGTVARAWGGQAA